MRTNRNVRLLWLAQLISELGDWFYTLVVVAGLLRVTGRATSIVLFFLLVTLPQVLGSPLAGAVNDRFSRKRVMIAADLLRVIVMTAMLFAQRSNALPLLYTLIAMEALFASAFEPARTAVISCITTGSDTVIANTLSATTWSIVLAAGAGLGGLLAVWLGQSVMFAADAASFVVSALLISRMRFVELHVDTHGAPLRDLFGMRMYLDGIRYILADKRRSATLGLKGALGCCIGANWVLLPVLGNGAYRFTFPHLPPYSGGLLAMSILVCARGCGSFFGPLVASLFTQSSTKRMRLTVGCALLVIAIGFGGEALAPNIAFTSIAAAIAHAGSAVVWVFSTTLLQWQTKDEYRGRVFATEAALNSTVFLGASALASFGVDGGWKPSWIAFAVALCFLSFASSWYVVQKWWNNSILPDVNLALE